MSQESRKGVFITFEGVEGCGKSTQIKRLRRHLKSAGHDVVLTREPGGTLVGEEIRKVLLDAANTTIGAMTELLLYVAARAQHVEQVILPSIVAGKIVLCDRFFDSTIAYQGAGRGVPERTLRTLHAIATQDLYPDMTILLDLPAEVGLARYSPSGRRTKKRHKQKQQMDLFASDRIERETLDFHERVRAEFLRLAEMEPRRIRVVDGGQSVKEVEDTVRGLVDALLRKP